MPVGAFRYENGKSHPVITEVTGNYTLTPDDNGGFIVVNSGTGKTVTIPQYLPVGFRCIVYQKGAGQITFATSSTTLRNVDSQTKSQGQYAKCYLDSPEADVFVLSGATGA